MVTYEIKEDKDGDILIIYEDNYEIFRFEGIYCRVLGHRGIKRILTETDSIKT